MLTRHLRLSLPSILVAVLTLRTAIAELRQNPLISYILFGASALIILGVLLLVLDEYRQYHHGK